MLLQCHCVSSDREKGVDKDLTLEDPFMPLLRKLPLNEMLSQFHKVFQQFVLCCAVL